MSRTDPQTMDELRRQVTELRASRARLLTAADDQRRSIERELHDGTMQHLVALGVNLQLASRLVETDPPGVPELLDEILQNVHEALDDVRRLAWRVYPSLLLGGDLGDAIRTAASLVGTPTRVEAAGFGGRAPELETSIYFCCVDLLQHAADDGDQATVRVWNEGELALFDVTIEGANLERWETRDLSRVSDRLAVFNGRLAVDPEPERGVRISGAIPMKPPVQALVPEPCSTSPR